MGKDLTIGNIYKEQNINKSNQTIKILSSTDISFLINIVFEEYREFVLKEYRQYKTLFYKIKDLRLSKYKL